MNRTDSREVHQRPTLTFKVLKEPNRLPAAGPTSHIFLHGRFGLSPAAADILLGCAATCTGWWCFLLSIRHVNDLQGVCAHGRAQRAHKNDKTSREAMVVHISRHSEPLSADQVKCWVDNFKGSKHPWRWRSTQSTNPILTTKSRWVWDCRRTEGDLNTK